MSTTVLNRLACSIVSMRGGTFIPMDESQGLPVPPLILTNFSVNVLLALSDPMHIHHEAAHRWFAAGGQSAWATCPITENGFVRIASHPNYPNRPGDVPAVLAVLRQFCAAAGHHFWIEDVSIRELLQPSALIPHSQITDVFLLGLAVHRGGKLATFDRRISTVAVQGGGEGLELIAP